MVWEEIAQGLSDGELTEIKLEIHQIRKLLDKD